MERFVGKEDQLKDHLERLALGQRKLRWQKYDSRMILFSVLSQGAVQNHCFSISNTIYFGSIRRSFSCFRPIPDKADERLHARAHDSI